MQKKQASVGHNSYETCSLGLSFTFNWESLPFSPLSSKMFPGISQVSDSQVCVHLILEQYECMHFGIFNSAMVPVIGLILVLIPRIHFPPWPTTVIFALKILTAALYLQNPAIYLLKPSIVSLSFFVHPHTSHELIPVNICLNALPQPRLGHYISGCNENQTSIHVVPTETERLVRQKVNKAKRLMTKDAQNWGQV